MKTIGIFTKDFSLYHDLINVLRKRKISYISLSSIKNIPNRIGVIITSHSEIHDIKLKNIIAADVYENIDHAVDLAMQLLIGKDMYSKVLIGIDPGEHPGIAIFGDDILLKKKNIESPEKVVKIIRRFLKDYIANETIIRIGHGSIINRNRIINSLIPLKIPIEIVDESKTTKSNPVKKLEKDSSAAASIALISGGVIQTKLPLIPTKGDIRNIQERSRKYTNGKISITEKSALLVLKGEISLSEAIEKDEVSKKHKRL